MARATEAFRTDEPEGLIVSEYYRPPSQTERVFNRIVSALMRLGVGAPAARQLEVRGRTSGQPRRTPVNLLQLDGEEYLVSPPGNTQWVRNIRAAGTARLLRGRRARDIRVTEIGDAAKLPMLRAYLQRWGGALGRYFDGVNGKSSDAELLRIAPAHPVFQLERT